MICIIEDDGFQAETFPFHPVTFLGKSREILSSIPALPSAEAIYAAQG